MVHKSGVQSLKVENSVETVENYLFKISFQQNSTTDKCDANFVKH